MNLGIFLFTPTLLGQFPPFFFLGFFLIQYFGIGTTAVAIFAVIIAIVIVQLSSNQTPVKQEEGGGFDDF